jgi:hypothetical protein
MRAQQPPALAIWLLERLGSGTTREAVIGDLVEQFTVGRSGWWFWRQVVVAIGVGNGRDVWSHKWLALRAIAVGWIASYGLAKIYWVALTMPLPATVVGPQPATLLNSLVLISVMHTAMARASAGWRVGRLHRPLRMAMVLMFLSSLLALDLPWLLRRAADAFENPVLFTPSRTSSRP